MEIDTVGTFQMSRAAHPHLKRGGGVIVNISATLHYGATFYQVNCFALPCFRAGTLQTSRVMVHVALALPPGLPVNASGSPG
jgi:NAD(P)-dependent dehydrogenase (short-subunit alcohol dehydrogenase family)